MELRVLKYFITVAREESISAAADYLHMTQPTPVSYTHLMCIRDRFSFKQLVTFKNCTSKSSN